MVDILNKEAIPTKAQVLAHGLPNFAGSNWCMQVAFQSKLPHVMALEGLHGWFRQVQT